MRDVLHNAVKCPTEKLGILVVHRNHDENLSLAGRIKEVLAESKPRRGESIGIGGDGGVSGLVS